MVRKDQNDVVYKTKGEKFDAVVDDIAERHQKGQPVLVGTISIEISEMLSNQLVAKGIPHNVLNAKQHEREAQIIVDAGQKGAVTIATNMAGRGVDIKLGDGVRERGGLYVLGTERHEARRIDNQLRGRSGRQGDPGETRFYLSGQDDLVRLFAGDRIHNIMERFKVPEDQPMEAGILSRQIENAQKKVEEQNFVARKNVLKYDDVLNKQRTVIYEQRRKVLEGEDLSDEVKAWVDEVIGRVVTQFTDSQYSEEWDLEGLVKAMDALYGQPAVEPISVDELREDVSSLTRETLIEDFTEEAQDQYAAKEKELGPELMRELERFIILQVVDTRWREHLENMDYLREGVHLRAMAQKDPLVEYTGEGHVMFEELNGAIREEVILHLFHAQLEPEDAAELQQAQEAQALDGGGLAYQHESLAGAQAIAAAGGNGDGNGSASGVTAGSLFAGGGSVATATRTVAERDKIGRNDPCWCGSGKKYKKCHGA
jgi:preprotein translocase subunit SecA